MLAGDGSVAMRPARIAGATAAPARAAFAVVVAAAAAAAAAGDLGQARRDDVGVPPDRLRPQGRARERSTNYDCALFVVAAGPPYYDQRPVAARFCFLLVL
jgi:hypothetical protein